MYKRHAHFVRMYSICAHFLGFVIIPFHKEQLSVLSLQRHQDKFLKSCRAWLCLRSVSRVMQLFIITRHRYPDLLYNSRSVFCFSWRRSCVLSATMASRCLLYFSICRKKKEETMLAFEMLLLLFETISEMYVVYLLFCFVFCTTHGKFSVYYKCLPQYYFLQHLSGLLPGSSSCPRGWLCVDSFCRASSSPAQTWASRWRYETNTS